MIVEGAGGLLVRLDTEDGTLLDLAAGLARRPTPSRWSWSSAAGLGTLNHTELTVGALRARGLEPAGLVLGSWPAEPGLAEQCNLEDLPRVTGVPLLAVVPEGSGALDRRGVPGPVAGLVHVAAERAVQEPPVPERVDEHRDPAGGRTVLRATHNLEPWPATRAAASSQSSTDEVQRHRGSSSRRRRLDAELGCSSAIIQPASPTAARRDRCRRRASRSAS